MDPAGLRPLGIGEIIDVAIKVYRARFGVLVKSVAVVLAPVFALSALIRISFPAGEDLFEETQPGATPDFNVDELWPFIAGTLLIIVLAYLASQIATGACFKAVSGAYLDEEAGWQDSLRFARSKLGSLVWLSFLTAVCVMPGLLLCLVPGIYLWIAWTVAAPVLLLEDVRGWKAMKRSRQLVKGRLWPTLAVVLLVAILTGHRAGGVRRHPGRRGERERQRGGPGHRRCHRADGQRRADHAAVGGGAHRPVLRPARPQGGLRPRAALPAHGRRPGHGGQPGVPAAAPHAGAATAVAGTAGPARRTGRRRRSGARRMPDRRRAVAVAVLAAIVVGIGPVGPASAQSVTGTQVQDLAARAAGDPRALAQLRAVREVDGRPVDMGRALAGAEGPGLAAGCRPSAAGRRRDRSWPVSRPARRPRTCWTGAGSSRPGCPGPSPASCARSAGGWSRWGSRSAGSGGGWSTPWPAGSSWSGWSSSWRR